MSQRTDELLDIMLSARAQADWVRQMPQQEAPPSAWTEWFAAAPQEQWRQVGGQWTAT